MADPAGVHEGLDSPLVDLSELTLEDIAELPDSALGAALREITDAAARSDALFTVDHRESLMRD